MKGIRAGEASHPSTKWAILALLGFFAAVAGASGAASAETLVPSGSLSADATWTSAGSPYVLEGDLTVPSGLTLTIGEGTRVEIPGAARLKVEGRLDVLGDSSAPVDFTTAGASLSWGGIDFNGAGSGRIENATLVSTDAALFVNTSGAVAVVDTIIRLVTGDAVLVTGDPAGVLLLNLTILDAGTGVRLQNGVSRLLADRITVNGTPECVAASSASDITIRASFFLRCGTYGVTLTLSSDVAVTGSNFTEWVTAAVSALSSTRVNVSGNSFYSGAPVYGVSLVGASDSVVADNVIDMRLYNRDVLFIDLPIGIYDRAPLGPNRIERNTVHAFYAGIRVEGAIFPQTVDGNEIQIGWDTGIEILDSPNQTVRGNTITGRDYPFAVNVTSPGTPWYYRQFVDSNNTVDGRPILYLVDRSGAAIDLAGGAGIVALVDSDNVTLTNGSLRHGVPSLLVASSRDIVARGFSVQSNATGIQVLRSSRVVLENVTVDGGLTCLGFRDGADNRASDVRASVCLHSLLTGGSESGLLVERLTVTSVGRVSFFEGSNLTLRDSHITGVVQSALSNDETRIARGGQALRLLGQPSGVAFVNVTVETAREALVFQNFSGLTLRELTIAQAVTGVVLKQMSGVLINGSALSGAVYGVRAEDLSDSRIEDTQIEGAAFEGFFCIRCSNVTFVANLVAGNGVGLAFLRGGSCLVTRNLFFFNTLHASADSADHDFDDGAVGNLWDDYTGLDADSDGIGDTPYLIATGVDQDNYPIARHPDDVPPSADAGPDIVAFEDEPVLLSAYLSSDDVGIRVYLWSFVEGGVNVTVPGLSTRYWFYTPSVYQVTLTVIDWGANRATDTLTVTILDRTRPRADAGGNRTVDEDVAVSLDARATTDNDPRFPEGAAFTWYVDDTNGTFVLFGSQASWTFATPGNFTVRLVVDDASGYTDSATIYITVRDRTAPALGNLETPLATEDAPFRAYGSAVTDNDPNWPVGMTSWFELWRGGALIALTNASPGVFNVSEPGPYTVFYFVSDASGNIGSSSITFNVADITPPDVSGFGDRQGEAGEPVNFDISPASDNDLSFPAGANATWTIAVASGRVTLAGLSVSLVFPAIGDFAVALHLRDASGNLGETSFIVRVRDTTAPVVTVTGPPTVEAGQVATFTANATDATDLAEFAWFVEGLATPRLGPVLNHRFFVPGSWLITVRVEDRLGHGTNASLTVVVVDTTPPIMIVDLDPLPRNGTIELAVFDVLQGAFLGTDNMASLPQVVWAWGDGNGSEGRTANHSWAEAGNYTLRVTATDAFGNTNSTTFRVRVAAAPAPPPDDTNTTGTLPTGTEFPTVAVAALLAAGVGGGVAIGFRAGRGGRRPDDKRE